jgi:threonine-phosphate decarboxylase
MEIERLLVNRNLKTATRAAHGGDVWRYPHTLIDFSSNVNPLGPSSRVLKAVAKAIAEVRSYPPSGEELSAAIATKHGVDERCVVLGNGSSELIKTFCEAFLSQGDTVVIPQPTFSEYEYFSKLYGASVRDVLMQPAEKDALLSSAGDAKVLFLCNPNNPTGHALALKEIEALAEEALRKDSLVFLDEAYVEFSNLESALQLVEAFPNLVVLRSMTKFYSIPGLRIGYCIASPEVAKYLRLALPPWNVNTLAQRAALAALGDGEFAEKSREYLAKEKERLFSELRRLPLLKVYPSAANFFLINIKETGLKSPEMKAKLVEKGVLIRDCSTFKHLGEEHIRVCVRKREENLRLLAAMEVLLNEQA